MIMKTLKTFMILATSLCLLLSCSRTYDYDESFSGMTVKASPFAPAVITVEPDGVDDTPTLISAFENAKASGPGSVVQLVEGEYHVGYMEVRDFYGFLKGAGKEKTIITVLPGMDLDELLAQHLLHCNMKFIGGDVNISHLTIQTPPGQISVGWPYMGHIYTLVNFSATSAGYELGNESRSIKVVIDNVNFRGQLLEGGPGYVNSYNCLIGVRAGFDYYSPYETLAQPLPRERIDFKITNCDFNTFCYGLGLEGINNGRIIIGENNNGNVFSNIDQQGGVWESRNSAVTIEGNTFNIPEFSYGLDLDDYPYYTILRNEPSGNNAVFDIRNNTFNMTNSTYALLLRNIRTRTNPGEPVTVFQVKNNLFNMTGGYERALISYYTVDMVIRNNRFTGYGDFALRLVNYSKGGLVLGNNFSTAEFKSAVAYLTPSTSNWTFVGGNLADKVMDYGTNNIFTGFSVNNSEAPFGETIVDNLDFVKEALRDLKGH